MAIYHLHVKNISRGGGRSVVAAAAYRAGECLPNEAEERLSAFGGRRDVLFNEIRLPEGAPPWMANRARLWNAVEAAEKRKDARLAKEIEFALPRELLPAEWRSVARQMADAYTAQGYVVDLAIHSDLLVENPHVHVLLTTRAIVGEGFKGKLRVADAVKFVTEARALWAKIANAALGKAGAAATIDHRSYRDQDAGLVPGTHRGVDSTERQRRRERSRTAENEPGEFDRGRLSREIKQMMDADRVRIKEERIALIENLLIPGNEEHAAKALELFKEELEREMVREGIVTEAMIGKLKSMDGWLKERLSERTLTVPGPDGELTDVEHLEAAQSAMLAEAERPCDEAPQPDRLQQSLENDWLERAKARGAASTGCNDSPREDGKRQWWRRGKEGESEQERDEIEHSR